jgi:hypothetical protein
MSSQFLNSNINNRKIIRIQDLWAREIKATYNKVLFYIYDDGTVKKKVIID